MNRKQIDWIAVSLYVALVLIGWASVYASEYHDELHKPIYDLSLRSGRQMLWLLVCCVLIALYLLIDFRLYEYFAYLLYAGMVVLLIVVLLKGKEVAGSRSWLSASIVNIQPSELAKFITALALARLLSNVAFSVWRYVGSFLLLGIMMLLITLQGDVGTALTFAAFLLMMYRSGMTPMPIVLILGGYVLFVLVLLFSQLVLISIMLCVGLLGIILVEKKTKKVLAVLSVLIVSVTFVASLEYLMKNLLRPYHYKRIHSMVNPAADPLGYGWNVTQSKIAIGSGGIWGKGFLQGTQTRLDFIPEESTDFIFCTVGEEHGWAGTMVFITLFAALIIRMVIIAERQKNKFALLYGYGAAGIIFFHFTVNIAMTVGLCPVIGIPLPFISYGGSSLCSFTTLLFVLLKFDMERGTVLSR